MSYEECPKHLTDATNGCTECVRETEERIFAIVPELRIWPALRGALMRDFWAHATYVDPDLSVFEELRAAFDRIGSKWWVDRPTRSTDSGGSAGAAGRGPLENAVADDRAHNAVLHALAEAARRSWELPENGDGLRSAITPAKSGLDYFRRAVKAERARAEKAEARAAEATKERDDLKMAAQSLDAQSEAFTDSEKAAAASLGAAILSVRIGCCDEDVLRHAVRAIARTR